MGLREWRTKRGMADPVRGEFRVSGSYHPQHQASSNFNDMLTGVVTADGVPPTPAEHMDRHALGYSNRVLPVLVDRADPTTSVVLWDEVHPVDFQAKAREAAQADAQRLAGGAPATPADPSVVVVDDVKDLPPWLSQAVEKALQGDGGAQNVEVHLGEAPGALTGGVPESTGRSTRAVLTGVTDVPTPAYALPGPTASLTDLTLQVQRPDGSSYAVQARMGFRSAERRAQLAVIGSSVPIRVDPADETHVSIDVAAWA